MLTAVAMHVMTLYVFHAHTALSQTAETTEGTTDSSGEQWPIISRST